MAKKRLKRCNCTHDFKDDGFRYDHVDTFYKIQMLDDIFCCPICKYFPWEVVVRGGKHDKDKD